MELRLDRVVANLQAKGRPQGEAGQISAVAHANGGTALGARIVLLDLGTVLSAVGLEGRVDSVVGKELQVGVQREGRGTQVPSLAPLPAVGGREHDALAAAALARVERIPAADAVRSLVRRDRLRAVALAAHGSRGQHARRVPCAPVRHEHQRHIAPVVEHARQLRVAIEAREVFGVNERTVLVERLGRDGHPPAGAEIGRLDRDRALVTVLPDFESPHALAYVIGHAKSDRAGGGEVAHARGVRSLGRVQRVDRLGDDEVQIREPLPVGVAHGVDGGVVHEERDVRAVIDVETAQEVLLRLAPAAVLDRGEARHGLEHALRSIAGHERQLGLARARIGPRDVRTCRRALAEHANLLHFGHRRRGGRRRRRRSGR